LDVLQARSAPRLLTSGEMRCMCTLVQAWRRLLEGPGTPGTSATSATTTSSSSRSGSRKSSSSSSEVGHTAVAATSTAASASSSSHAGSDVSATQPLPPASQQQQRKQRQQKPRRPKRLDLPKLGPSGAGQLLELLGGLPREVGAWVLPQLGRRALAVLVTFNTG
jgi:hypothetical protein